MKIQKGQIPVFIIVTGIIVASLVIAFFVFGGQKLLRPSPMEYMTPTPSAQKGDIDRSGVVDSADMEFVRSNVGCKKDNPCWQKVIGKTRDGDNPIYVYDIDLNQDEMIDQSDLDLVR